MYATHARAIQAWARKSPDNLARVIQLSIVSAHAPFSRIVHDMQACVDETPAMPGILYGWKAKAFGDVWEARDAIAWNLADICDLAGSWRLPDLVWRKDAADYALCYLAGFHGLGLAKAGFALQMGLGLSGCLDVHNLRKAGYSPSVCRMNTARAKNRPEPSRQTMLKRTMAYNRVVYTMGGTERLWDAWCEDMAARNPKTYKSAFHVSSLHCEALGV